MSGRTLASDASLGNRLRREMERTALRVRNGLRYAAGSEWAPLNPTPRDQVWEQGPVTLWRVRSDQVRFEPPVLVFIGLVSRSWILDLHREASLVRSLRDAGFDVYMLDWGEPGPEDATSTLETYIGRYLERAMAAVVSRSGADSLTAIGYCMGGNLALLGLGAGARLPVRNLVLMATAVDFMALPGLAGAIRDRDIDPSALLDWTGNVPPQYIAAFFRVRKPTADVLAYANLWEHLWNDDYVAAHEAMARWAGAHVAFPGAAFRQVHEQWLRDNGFMTGRLRFAGGPVRLDRIRCSVLAVLALRDDLVVPESARPIAGLLGSAELELLELPAGHAGLSASRSATRTTFPAIVDWLERHSERRTERA